MSHQKQVTFYNNLNGLNWWSIYAVLEELDMTFDAINVDFSIKEQKSPAFVALNPNGKIPVLVDHQRNEFVVWESKAIISYLTDYYDKDHKISFPEGDEKTLMTQWLYFQASGQGPYFGQAQWFQQFHHEKVPSAIERYQKEIRRVFGVLDSVLAKQDWLVGDKLSLADLSFFKYNDLAIQELLEPGFDFAKEYPNAAKWHQRILERPSVASVYRYEAELRKASPPCQPNW